MSVVILDEEDEEEEGSSIGNFSCSIYFQIYFREIISIC